MSVIFSLITALLALLIAFQTPGLGGEVHQKKVKTIALLIGCLAVLSSIYNILFRFLAYLARNSTLCFQSKIIKQVWDESPVTCYNGERSGAGRVPHYKMP
ncbi:MAG: hypothetical protein QNJ08_11850 [Crocosphaera sp.]|nr:hypothetical protein [Crocosphaera sp.]